MAVQKITQDEVSYLFDYNSDGTLTWRVNRGKIRSGDKAGSQNLVEGYYTIGINYKQYYLHHIIWIYHKGYIPENFIDHIDRNKLNNRIENLREVSYSCSARNRRVPSNNSSGVSGVTWNKHRGTWTAKIGINGKHLVIGSFFKFEEAVMARYKKEVELQWPGCNSTSSAYLYLKDKNMVG